MTIEKIPGQQAITQFLVDPKNLTTPAYITSSPDVAQKRANKGDRVVEIDRVAHHGHGIFEPLHIRIHGDNTPPDDEEL